MSRFPLPVGISRGLERALLETVPETPARRGRPPGSRNKPRRKRGEPPVDHLLAALQQHHPRRVVAPHKKMVHCGGS